MARDYVDVLNGTFGDEKAAPSAGLSFIFGSGSRLLDMIDEHEGRRVVVYPCSSEDEISEMAQGMMCALTWVLNSFDGVTAIPLIMDSPLSAVDWKPSASAFNPDSFMLDGLGEDTLVTAILQREFDAFKWVLTGTTDIEDEETFSIELRADDIGELPSLILEAADHLGLWLGEDIDNLKHTRKKILNSGEWLNAAFRWHQAALTRAINEQTFDLSASSFRDIVAVSTDSILSQLTVKGVALAISWFEEMNAEQLVTSLTTLPHWQDGASAIARALIEIGDTRKALSLLETATKDAPEFPLNWLVLARLYTAVQQPSSAVETLQDAIELHQNNVPLLMQYGEVLINYADQNITLDEIVFIDENIEPAAAFEAIAAYEQAVNLLHGDQQAAAYVQLISALARYASDHIWPAFEALAAIDKSGSYTELALNTVAAQSDMEKVIPSLSQATQSNPDTGQIWRNLAYAYYLTGETDRASAAVDHALSHAVDTRSRGDYELLALYAQDRTLETELGEIANSLNVDSDITDRSLELLEWVVSEAPHYIEGYLLLGRAYAAGGESTTALEVLLDAEKNLGADAEIYVAIIDLLLEAGEEPVALDYVTKGLDAFPRYVPLLVRAALVTDALGDRQGAKAFLRQAHNVTPYHKEIMRVMEVFRDTES